MAYTTVGTLMGATLALDIQRGRVSAIRAVNAWTQPVTYQVLNAGTIQWERTVQPGETVDVNVPNNLRFDFDTDLAEWGLNMTPVWT